MDNQLEKKRTVIVTCSLDEGSVEKVTKSLKETNFEIESVLQFAGSIIGKWKGSLGLLEKIPGVTDVSEQEEKYPQ